jgi:transposase-like protein
MLERKDAVIAEAAARRHWRKDDARVVIDAWRRSGQTMSAFARFYGIQYERLARWKRRLRGEPNGKPRGAVRFHRCECGLWSGRAPMPSTGSSSC